MHKRKVGEDQNEPIEKVLLESGHSVLVTSENYGVSVVRVDGGIILCAARYVGVSWTVPTLRLKQRFLAGEVGKESCKSIEHPCESRRVSKRDVGQDENQTPDEV